MSASEQTPTGTWQRHGNTPSTHLYSATALGAKDGGVG